MKVLHLISGGDTGGAKTHLISLFNGFNKFIDAKIICFIEDTFYYESLENNIDIEVYEQRNRFDLSVVSKLVREIEKEDYDIVHCHGARANFIGVFLKMKVNKPFVTTIHSDYKLDFKDNIFKYLIFTPLNILAINRFDNFIAVSNNFKEMLVDRGFSESRIFTVYNGINFDREVSYLSKEDFLKKNKVDYNGELLVGIVGRLDLVKNHNMFLKAAKYALEKNNNIRFLIAGDGGERAELEEQALALGIEDKVHFLGYLDDIYSFFNSIDINTLTSVSESFPYVVLEGAYMRKPIISTRVGGISKLIRDSKGGYIVDVNDYRSMGEKIYQLSQDQSLIGELGNNLYNEVRKNYSSEKMALDHIAAYKKILANGKKEN